MNRTQKFALNSTTAALYQIIAMLLGFITPSLMISTYGSEVNGLVSSINQLISYISLVEAGLSGAAVFSLYKPLANNDQAGVNGIVSAAKQFYIKTGYIFSAAALLLGVLFALMKSTQALSPFMVFLLVMLLSANGCVDFFVLARFRVILTADQRMYVISLLSTIQVVIRAVVIIVSCKFKLHVLVLYALALLPIFVKVVVLYYYCKRAYPYLDFTAEPNIESLGRRYDVIYQQVLGTVQTGAPTVIATVFLNLVTVSVYSVYNMVLNGINGVLNIFVSGLPAGFGELIAKKEHDNLRKTTSEFEVAYYFILSVVYGLTMALLLPFIEIYTRNFYDANYYIPSLAVLMVLNGICYSVKVPQSMLMISAGMYKEQRWRATAQAIIIVVGGIVLVQFMGLQGIMISSILSNVYRTIDLLLYVPKHITHSSIPRTARRILGVFINSIIVCLPTSFFEFKPNSYVSWTAYAMVLGIYAVTIVGMITYLLDRAEFHSLKGRILKILMRRK